MGEQGDPSDGSSDNYGPNGEANHNETEDTDEQETVANLGAGSDLQLEDFAPDVQKCFMNLHHFCSGQINVSFRLCYSSIYIERKSSRI